MNQLGFAAAVFGAGLGIGLAYFAALKVNIELMMRSDRPWVLAIGGFILRAGLAASAISLVAGGRWQGFAAAVAGFILARWISVRLFGPSRAHQASRGD
ncbi:MAG: ATP synthase subunit I [Desulfatibacillaceae bacterium]